MKKKTFLAMREESDLRRFKNLKARRKQTSFSRLVALDLPPKQSTGKYIKHLMTGPIQTVQSVYQQVVTALW